VSVANVIARYSSFVFLEGCTRRGSPGCFEVRWRVAEAVLLVAAGEVDLRDLRAPVVGGE
jgi:hypothetical protein